MIMYILNVVNVIKKMTVKDLMEFIYENCCQGIGLTKAESNYSLKSL